MKKYFKKRLKNVGATDLNNLLNDKIILFLKWIFLSKNPIFHDQKKLFFSENFTISTTFFFLGGGGAKKIPSMCVQKLFLEL